MVGNAFAQQISFTPEEQQWLNNNPVITSVNDKLWAPIDFYRNGNATGLSVDYLNLVASKVGLEVEYISHDNWLYLEDQIRQGNADMTQSIRYTDARAEFLNFTEPYLNIPTVYFGNVGDDRIKDSSDLQGKTVGLIRNWANAARFKENNPNLEILEYTTEQDALVALSGGLIDVFAGSLAVTNNAIFSNFITNIEVIGAQDVREIGGEDTIRFGIRKDLPELFSILEKGMAAVSEDEFNGLVDRWQASYLDTTEDFLTEEERRWIRENPVIRSTNDRSWAPIDFKRNGEATGFSIDYLNLVASKVGLSVEYYDSEFWSTQLNMLARGQLDVAHSISYSDERAEYLDFTKSYLNLPTVFFGRPAVNRIESPEDLIGYKVGVISEWGLLNEFNREYPGLELVLIDSEQEALLALSSNTIDIFVGSLAVMNYSMSNSLISGFEVIGFVEETSSVSGNDIHLAARNDLPMLSGILQKGMDQVSQEEFAALTRKWQTSVTSMNNTAFTEEELEWLENNKLIKVAVDPTAIPWETVDEDGNIDGIAGEYLARFEQLLDVEFEWVGNNNFDSGLSEVISGNAMMLSSIIQTPERMEDFLFSSSYLTISNVIYARTNAESRATLETLADKTVVLPREFAIVEFLRQDYPDINIALADSSEEALLMLSEGGADAYIGSIASGSRIIAENRIQNVEITGDTPYKFGIAMGIRNDLPVLESIIRKALASVDESERLLITQKWLSLRTNTPPDYTVIWQIAVALILMLTVVFIWALSLRREVRRRKLVELNLVQMRRDAEAARLEAELANNAKSNFLANMSHEIRTPLNAIIGFSEIISSEIFGKVKNSKYKQYIDDIKISGEHLAAVINDILDLSKIESGKWDLDEQVASIDAVVSDAIKMVENLAKDKAISIHINSPDNYDKLKVRGDTNCLKRVLINLLSNAIKFTNKKGSVTCEVFSAANGDLKIAIEDNGIGIAADRLDHVLNPFEQANENTHVNEMGTGLGLSIVKELVDLHGGEFTLESKLNVGTRAIFSIPSARVIV